MSELTNSLEIDAIKLDLANKVTFSGMSNAAKKDAIDQLFPEGVAFWYSDPKVVSGDKVFGWGDPSINTGGFFFGQATAAPVTDANLDFKFRS
jgi:hypothetical protein